MYSDSWPRIIDLEDGGSGEKHTHYDTGALTTFDIHDSPRFALQEMLYFGPNLSRALNP